MREECVDSFVYQAGDKHRSQRAVRIYTGGVYSISGQTRPEHRRLPPNGNGSGVEETRVGVINFSNQFLHSQREPHGDKVSVPSISNN